MPQITQLAATYSSQIFWLIVFFGLTYFVIGRGMVPKVMATVESRDAKIASDLAAAQAANDMADAEEEEWRRRENDNRAKAQGMIAEAKAKAASQSETRIAKAQAGFDERIEQAEQRIAETRSKAMGEISLGDLPLRLRISGTVTRCGGRLSVISVTPVSSKCCCI